MERTKRGRFVKGKSGNPNGRPKKGIIAHTILNSHVAPERTTADKVLNNKDQWIPFGSDNLFPQALSTLSRRSPVHRSILNSKTTYTTGKGFSGDERLLEYLKRVNAKETFQTVFKKLIYDQYLQGNSYLELVQKDGVLVMFHKDATKGRMHKDGKSILFHPNWAKVKKTKELLTEIPLYPNFERVNGEMRSILHMKSYEPEFSYYGVPEYIAAIDSAGIAYKTNKWNISRLDNSFQSSGVLLVSGDMGVDDAEKLKDAVKDEFTGEGNQGKILFIAKNLGGEGETEFIPINSGNEGDWMQLHQQSTSELVISHSWFPSLSGIQTAGRLGNTQEIRNSYQIALNTVISKEQQFLLGEISKVLMDFGYNTEDWEVVNMPPVNIIDLIDVNMVVKKGEARAMLGLEVEEDDEEMNEFIKDGTTNNTAGGNR